jgi:hypothetical protein
MWIMLDLSQFDIEAQSEEGTWVDLDGPDGAPLMDDEGNIAGVLLRGHDSPSVRTVANKQHDRRMERTRRGKSFATAAEVRSESAEVLAAATIAFRNMALDGQPLVYSPELARKIYNATRFGWIVEQLSRHLSDRERFFPKSSTS